MPLQFLDGKKKKGRAVFCPVGKTDTVVRNGERDRREEREIERKRETETGHIIEGGQNVCSHMDYVPIYIMPFD